MSGHNKWSQIKRKKEATDKEKSKNFAHVGKEIQRAVRSGGEDPLTNTALRNALQRAREVNMPKASIERAVERGSGRGSSALTSVHYEAYGPGGAALLIETSTDNKNRTVAELKHLIEQHGGRMADAGSVSWLFVKKGYILIPSKIEDESLEEAFISGGVEDYSFINGIYTVVCGPERVASLTKAISEATLLDPIESGVRFIAQSIATLNEKDKDRLEALVSALEDHDDVESVFTNHTQ